MACSPPGSSVCGSFQVRILEWVAISSSRGSFWPRDRIRVSCASCTGRQILYHCIPWVLFYWMIYPNCRKRGRKTKNLLLLEKQLRKASLKPVSKAHHCYSRKVSPISFLLFILKKNEFVAQYLVYLSKSRFCFCSGNIRNIPVFI